MSKDIPPYGSRGLRPLRVEDSRAGEELKHAQTLPKLRARAIAVLIDKYFRPGTVAQAGYPLDMRYAGPREALLHAVFRQNYGYASSDAGD